MKSNIYLITYKSKKDNKEYSFTTDFICLCGCKIHFNTNLIFAWHEELSLHDIKDLKISTFNK